MLSVVGQCARSVWKLERVAILPSHFESKEATRCIAFNCYR